MARVWRGAHPALVLTALVLGCSSGELELAVDLRTDLRPGVTFTTAHTELDGAGGAEGPATRAVTTRDDFIDGGRIAEFDELRRGPLAVTVRLRDEEDELVADRRARLTITADRILTIPITSDCLGVTCPGEGDDADYDQCLDSACVPQECVDPSDEACPPEVACGGSGCSSNAACAEPRCLGGLCLVEPHDDRCEPDEVCAPTAGCVVRDGPRTDAAVSDAAVDASVTDAAIADGALDADASAGALHVTSGSYVGDGTSGRAVEAGLRPVLVIVKSEGSGSAMARTTMMPAGMAKRLAVGQPLEPGRILSLGSDGFTVGDAAEVNDSGVTYYWVAFAAVAGQTTVGSYVGDGNDDRIVTGVGFHPDAVMTMPDTTRSVYLRSTPMPAGTSRGVQGNMYDSKIRELVDDGFVVARNPSVNSNGEEYHYVAWKSTAGGMAVGGYTGDATDDRAIGGSGFAPEYVVLLPQTNSTEHKPASTGVSADLSLSMVGGGNHTDSIQALLPDGFEVGAHERANAAGERFYWLAFAP